MGTFDTFRFSKHLEMFPEGLPRDDWQTKELDASGIEYWVDRTGRVARKDDRYGLDEDQFFHNDSAHFCVYLKQFLDSQMTYLKIRVEFGYLKAVVVQGRTAERDENEPGWTIPATGPESEDD
jgi:hypothetical protein